MDQLLVAVGARGGGRDEAVRHLVEEPEERLVGLAAERAQHARLVEARHVEQPRVEPAVAHALVVREVDPVGGDLLGPADEGGLDAEQPRVPRELLANPERAHYQPPPPVMRQHQPHGLELHEGLAEAERREDRAPPARHGPAHDGALEAEEHVRHLVARVEARRRGRGALVVQELRVAGRQRAHETLLSGPRKATAAHSRIRDTMASAADESPCTDRRATMPSPAVCVV